MRYLAVCSGLLSLLAAAGAHAEIRLYDVAARNSKEIVDALSSLLEEQCRKAQEGCNARLLAGGQILVEAPPATHDQIDNVLKAIAASAAETAPRVTLRYWVLAGMSGKADAIQSESKLLAPVIAQLRRLHGDMGFAIEDSVSLATASGSSAQMGGGPLTVSERVIANGDKLGADIRIMFSKPPLAQDLNVAVTIERGQFLVLGERTYRGSADSGAPLGTLFYIVHWPQDE